MTPEQILLLARAYADFQGVTLRRIAVLAARHPMLFDRLCAGKGAHQRTLEMVALWLSEHWPSGLLWPPEIPRPAFRHPEQCFGSCAQAAE